MACERNPFQNEHMKIALMTYKRSLLTDITQESWICTK